MGPVAGPVPAAGIPPMKSPSLSENLILATVLLVSAVLLVGLIWKAGREIGRSPDFGAEPTALVGANHPGS